MIWLYFRHFHHVLLVQCADNRVIFFSVNKQKSVKKTKSFFQTMSEVDDLTIIVSSSDPAAQGTAGNFKIKLSTPLVLKGTWFCAANNVSYANPGNELSVYVQCQFLMPMTVGSQSYSVLCRCPPVGTGVNHVYKEWVPNAPWARVGVEVISEVQLTIRDSDGGEIPSTDAGGNPYPATVQFSFRQVSDNVLGRKH